MNPISRRQLIKSAAGLLSAAHPFGHLLFAAEPTATKKDERSKRTKKHTTTPAVDDVYKDAVFVPGEPPATSKDGFTLAVLPDTQNYCQEFPQNYHAQTKWIVDNMEKRRIAAVLHLGDIVNRNREEQWVNAKAAMDRLDGHVPYFLTTGNHDYSSHNEQNARTTYFNDFFPVSKFSDSNSFGGTYDREPDQLENNFGFFTAGGREFIVLSLEFAPRNDVVRWGNEVLQKYKDREAILVTHAYMFNDDTRYDWKHFHQRWNPHAFALAKRTEQDVNDGEELWNKLVKDNSVIMTLNGHVLGDGLGRLTSQNTKGHNVYQMLVNFQMKPNGGDGWLRLIEFSGDGKTIQVIDYSPTRNQCNVSEQNRFTLTA